MFKLVTHSTSTSTTNIKNYYTMSSLYGLPREEEEEDIDIDQDSDLQSDMVPRASVQLQPLSSNPFINKSIQSDTKPTLYSQEETKSV